MLHVLLLLAGLAAVELPTRLRVDAAWTAVIAFSPDGKLLATGSSDGVSRRWSLDGRGVDGSGFRVGVALRALALGPDGSLVGGTDDGSVVRFPAFGLPRTLSRQRGAVLAIAISPDGKAIAAGGFDGVIRLSAAERAEKPRELFGHKSWVNSLAFSRDGKRLVSGSSDGTARIWDAETGKAVKTFELPAPREIRSVALSPDGTILAAAVRYGSVVAWDVKAGKELSSPKAHDGEAWAVAFSPDGKTLASGGGDWGKPGTVKLWNTSSWKERVTIPHPDEVLSVAFSPDGVRLAIAGMGREARVWRLDYRERRR